MKRFLTVLLLGLATAAAGCSDKAVYPSDTTKPPPTAPGKDAQAPSLPKPPQ